MLRYLDWNEDATTLEVFDSVVEALEDAEKNGVDCRSSHVDDDGYGTVGYVDVLTADGRRFRLCLAEVS